MEDVPPSCTILASSPGDDPTSASHVHTPTNQPPPGQWFGFRVANAVNLLQVLSANSFNWSCPAPRTSARSRTPGGAAALDGGGHPPGASSARLAVAPLRLVRPCPSPTRPASPSVARTPGSSGSGTGRPGHGSAAPRPSLSLTSRRGSAPLGGPGAESSHRAEDAPEAARPWGAVGVKSSIWTVNPPTDQEPPDPWRVRRARQALQEARCRRTPRARPPPGRQAGETLASRQHGVVPRRQLDRPERVLDRSPRQDASRRVPTPLPAVRSGGRGRRPARFSSRRTTTRDGRTPPGGP